MKPLHQFINEAMFVCPIFESFGSQIIGEILSKLPKNRYNSKYLFSMFKWDEITDNDIEKVTPEEARKLAYKKDSDAIILWISGDGELIANTCGHYDIMYQPKAEKIGIGWNNCKTVKKLAPNADYAIVIKDPDKFSTAKLRELRREMKKDALALKTEEQVREENMKKFEKMRQQIIIDKNANSATLEAKFEKVKSLYNECAEAINNLEILKDKIKYLKQLNDDFGWVLERFADAIYQIEDWTAYGAESNNANTQYTAELLKFFNERLSKFENFCKKLLVKISD